MQHLKKIIFLLITLSTFVAAQAQTKKSRASLEQEKKNNLRKIISVRKILNNTQKEKESSVGEIKAIGEQIDNQEKRIELVSKDINLIKVEMEELKKAQSELELKLKNLRHEYAEMLYKESKNSSKLTKLGFLFSSSSINELFMRYKYLEQYTENRKQQLVQINKIAEMLRERQKTLLHKKISRQQLIEELKIENKNLAVLKDRQSLVLEDLSKREEELKAQLEKSKAAVSNLNSLISKVITAEKTTRKVPASRREIEETKTKTAKAESKTKAAEPEKKETVSYATNSSKKFKNFAAAKHNLSWPVNGFISDRFGIKNHPVLKGVKVDNNGIDIQTENGAIVRAVFEGLVLDISQIPGLNNVVAIQHGDYYTVYANLETVNVKINQEVNNNQPLGTAAKKDGYHEINFQIWHNFDKLNPEPWLLNK